MYACASACVLLFEKKDKKKMGWQIEGERKTDQPILNCFVNSLKEFCKVIVASFWQFASSRYQLNKSDEQKIPAGGSV